LEDILEEKLEGKFLNVKGAEDVARGTADSTLMDAGSTTGRAEVMRAGTSRFAEAGLKGPAADMAEVGMVSGGTEGSDEILAGASGANSDKGANGCSTLERSGW
jgi:hypothetical protein